MLRTRLSSHYKLAAAVCILFAGTAWAAGPTFQVIHTFEGTPDGANSWAQVAVDAVGNVYGTTTEGGARGNGCVYELSPPVPGGAWTENVIYSFQGGTADGRFPSSGLVIDNSGNLFGTTFVGGAQNLGLVFELSPPTQSGGAWTETVLYSFTSTNNQTTGYGGNQLLLKGNSIFGSTLYGGLGNGNVFEMQKGSAGSWAEEGLYEFTGRPSGEQVEYEGAALVADGAGNLYGTTSSGGIYSAGSIFEVSPPAVKGGRWTQKEVYSFGGYGTDAVGVTGGVVLDSAGNLYGAAGGGTNSLGAVFELSPPATAGAPWTESILYNFKGGATDGSAPYAGVVRDPAGNLFGVTYTGGPGNCSFSPSNSGCGTVYEISSSTGGTWTETLLHTFSGSSDGQFPYGGLTIDRHGRLYGTTQDGGAKGFGTVFRVLP
jgi:uncharacterized repeat protein (TIGR03803 family)